MPCWPFDGGKRERCRGGREELREEYAICMLKHFMMLNRGQRVVFIKKTTELRDIRRTLGHGLAIIPDRQKVNVTMRSPDETRSRASCLLV